MAKKMTQAAGSAGNTTIQLSVPIAMGAAGTIDRLTLRRPTLGDHVASEQAPPGMARTIAFWAHIAGVPVKVMESLKTRDAAKIQKWLREAALLEEPPPGHIDDGDKRTFNLIVPINDGRTPRITLREPDLAAGIAVEKFKNEHEQMAASIAVLAGITIPEANQLDMRDVDRIEAWLVPFVAGSSSTDGDPGAP